METLTLVRDFGIPIVLLIAAVGALWKAWRIERKTREGELKQRRSDLEKREEELHILYRKLALRELRHLIDERQAIAEDGSDG